MDIKPIMSKFGFGHRCTDHIVIDRDGELWLALAPGAAVTFLSVMAGAGQPGTLKVEPLEDGQYVPFTYTATESLLELTTEKGAKIKMAIDKDAQAIRITGDIALRLNGVDKTARSENLNTPGGVVLSTSMGMIRYYLTAKKGKISFDDTWVFKSFTSVPAVLEIEPEGGEFELCVFDLPAETETPPITKTLSECVAENSADFKEFLNELVDVPPEWQDVKEKIAYPVWLCHRVLDGVNEVIVENKYSSKKTSSMLMSLASMAFKDAKKAVDMLLSYPVDFPPVAGVAAARLLEDNLLNDSRGDIYRVYSALEAFIRMCMNKRTMDKDELSFCAYRFEGGIDRSPEYFKVGEPVFTPDINAYLVIISEVIGKLANMEYDVGVGKKWEAHAKALKSKLIAELWDGEDFIGKNARTGEASRPDKFLSLIPIVLGGRLPGEIVSKLATKIDAEIVGSATGFLLARGLFDAGENDAAKELAVKALTGVRESNIECPFYGASLLALAHKVL